MSRLILDREWLASRAELNDAKISRIDQSGADVVLRVSNEWACLEGLPEYPGFSPVDITVKDGAAFDNPGPETLKEFIYEVSIESVDAGPRLKIVWYGQQVLEITGERIWVSAPGGSEVAPP